MKPLMYAVVGALVVGAAVVANVPPPPPGPQPRLPAWECKLIRMGSNHDADEKRLNDYGAEGWEVATAFTPTANDSRLVMRRPKR